jgi:hypothetical protein
MQKMIFRFTSIYADLLPLFALKRMRIKATLKLTHICFKMASNHLTVETFEHPHSIFPFGYQNISENLKWHWIGNSLDAEINNGYVVLNISEAGKRYHSNQGVPLNRFSSQRMKMCGADVGRWHCNMVPTFIAWSRLIMGRILRHYLYLQIRKS